MWAGPTRLHVTWLRLWLKVMTLNLHINHLRSPQLAKSAIVPAEAGSALVFFGNTSVASQLFTSLVGLHAFLQRVCVFGFPVCVWGVFVYFWLCSAYFEVCPWEATVKLTEVFSSCALSMLRFSLLVRTAIFFFIRVPVGILFSVIVAKCYSCTTQPPGSYDKNNNKKIYHGKKTLTMISKINNQDIKTLIGV